MKLRCRALARFSQRSTRDDRCTGSRTEAHTLKGPTTSSHSYLLSSLFAAPFRAHLVRKEAEMNCPTRDSSEGCPGWNQNPPFLAPELTTRASLAGLALTRHEVELESFALLTRRYTVRW